MIGLFVLGVDSQISSQVRPWLSYIGNDVRVMVVNPKSSCGRNEVSKHAVTVVHNHEQDLRGLILVLPEDRMAGLSEVAASFQIVPLPVRRSEWRPDAKCVVPERLDTQVKIQAAYVIDRIARAVRMIGALDQHYRNWRWAPPFLLPMQNFKSNAVETTLRRLSRFSSVGDHKATDYLSECAGTVVDSIGDPPRSLWVADDCGTKLQFKEVGCRHQVAVLIDGVDAGMERDDVAQRDLAIKQGIVGAHTLVPRLFRLGYRYRPARFAVEEPQPFIDHHGTRHDMPPQVWSDDQILAAE